jgi:hypothetical protein
MNPMAHIDPPDEPPVSWQVRDLGRRFSLLEARMTANEQRMGGEIEVNIRRDELINGEFGLINAMKANTDAIRANTDAIDRDRQRAAAREQDRATFLRRTAVGLAVSLIIVLASAIASGTIHVG